ncbi:3,4-dihydroxy-2-butanone-4-phosphate synthase [Bacillus sp. ISL-7]|uniref:3,4-dihydroxy-2-butanone-4-phosphate synthase n=1 Tax=Bacillus sp. ISL-7 TaxID=2819136 RepID=UPI00255726A2|nr:3,4-dihydroxy-2-butanone-4-phosphate synthase [Bacillus sp. ISL-7]
MTPQVKTVIEELSCGKLVLLVDQLGHGKLISLVEHITPSLINFMVTHGRGMVSVGIEKSRAVELGFQLQHTAYADNQTPAYTISVDVDGTTTGISAFERYDTIKAIIHPKRKSNDFKKHGHIFPVIAHQNGIFGKQSHVEAGIEISKFCNSYPSVVMCDVLNEKGEVANHNELEGFSEKFQIKIMNIEDLIQYFFNSQLFVKAEKQIKVENRIGEFEILAYSNKMDSFYDYIFFTEKLHAAGVTPVYIHKECDL